MLLKNFPVVDCISLLKLLELLASFSPIFLNPQTVWAQTREFKQLIPYETKLISPGAEDEGWALRLNDVESHLCLGVRLEAWAR